MDKIMVSMKKVENKDIVDLINTIDSDSIWGYATTKHDIYTGLLKLNFNVLLVPKEVEDDDAVRTQYVSDSEITKYMTEVTLVIWSKKGTDEEYEFRLNSLKDINSDYVVSTYDILVNMKDTNCKKICLWGSTKNLSLPKDIFDYVLIDGSQDNLNEVINRINKQFE